MPNSPNSTESITLESISVLLPQSVFGGLKVQLVPYDKAALYSGATQTDRGEEPADYLPPLILNPIVTYHLPLKLPPPRLDRMSSII